MLMDKLDFKKKYGVTQQNPREKGKVLGRGVGGGGWGEEGRLV